MPEIPIDVRKGRNEDLKVPDKAGEAPRPATEPRPSADGETPTQADPVTGAPNRDAGGPAPEEKISPKPTDKGGGTYAQGDYSPAARRSTVNGDDKSGGGQ